MLNRKVNADTGDWLDGFAVSASAVCMVHCLGLPILIALLPALADRIDPGESFHALVLLLAVPTSAFALISGWRRYGTAVPLIIGTLGLVLMATGIAFASNEILETSITVAGSVFLAVAHLSNWRGRRRSSTAHSR